MLLEQFNFDLPHHLIARYPLAERSASRLLCLNKTTKEIAHRHMGELPGLLSPEDLLVFNNTRVIPARWKGIKVSGGRVELLIERILDYDQALVHLKSSKTPKIGSYLLMEQDIKVKVLDRRGSLFVVECLHEQSLGSLLERHGHIPIPHYMQRDAEEMDKTRYQTLYASQPGAVAAPTAGLHFDEALFAKLKQRGIKTAFLTLHIGAGTFQPVREEMIQNHQMHAEYLEVSAELCAQVAATKAQGGRVIAVGTTSVRALETASQGAQIAPYYGETRLFIYPGYTFRCVDAILTNFHLPKSSLLMLVAAFGGHAAVMNSYQQAIAAEYRFYSYGDAMWIE